MYAVIKTGGKQYRVAKDDLITVERVTAGPGDVLAIDEVLMLGGEDAVTVGAPFVDGACVAAEVVEQMRGDKLVVFKKRRRQNSRRKNGHRQLLSVLKITDILTDGRRPAASAKAPVPAGGIKDDVSLIDGVGPTLEKRLAEAGVTSLSQIAAWTDDDVTRFDEELGARGRIEREEWVQQAKDMLAGEPPRAKIDQKKAES